MTPRHLTEVPGSIFKYTIEMRVLYITVKDLVNCLSVIGKFKLLREFEMVVKARGQMLPIIIKHISIIMNKSV